MELIYLNPCDIRSDQDRFRISLRPPSPDHLELMRKDVWREPIWVAGKRPPFLIISGFRTLQAACLLEKRIPALCVSENAIDSMKMWELILPRMMPGRYVDGEIAWAFQKMSKNASLEQLLSDADTRKISPCLNLRSIRFLQRLPRTFFIRAVRHHIPMHRILVYANHQPRDRRRLLVITQMATDMTQSIFRQFENDLRDLSSARQQDIHRILKDSVLLASIHAKGSLREKGILLAEQTHRMRFPSITVMHEKFMELIKRNSVHPSMKIFPPPQFEGNWLELHLRCSSSMEFNERLDDLRHLTSLITQLFGIWEHD